MPYSTRLEGIAEDLLASAGFGDEPVDGTALAACCGLEVVFSDVSECILLEPAIYVPLHAREQRVHGLIGHELGHWAMRRIRQPDRDEREADYLAGALIVPRRWLLPRLRRGWDLDALRREHPYASAEMLAHRIVQCREAHAAIYDDRRLRRRLGLPIARERELVDEALATRAPVRVDDLTGAWPVFDGAWRRVVVLASVG